MFRSSLKIAIGMFTCLVLSTHHLSAGTSGKIAGRVIDAQTKEPLPGVNVLITRIWIDGVESDARIRTGGSSNVDGQYFILNVEPGEYTLHARLVGYRESLVQHVQVYVDRTTTVDFQLSATTIDLADVVIIADRERVRKDVAYSARGLTTQEIKAAPQLGLTDLLTNEPGVERDAYGLTIRGGTEKEVAYNLDGVSLGDSKTNRPYTNVNTELIKEIQLVTGGFNAEYSDARSGVVNIVTKRSPDRYTGSLKVLYSPPALKHFGPNMWTNDNWWNFGRFQHMDAIEGPEYANELGDTVKSWVNERGENVDRDRDGIPDFVGWNTYAASLMNQYKLSPEDCLKLWKYQHRNEEFAKELDVDPVLKYGDKPDYQIETSLGGPLFPFAEIPVLSDIDFFGGYSRRFAENAFQLSRDGVDEENAQVRLTYQVQNDSKVAVFGLYGETHANGYFLGEDHTYASNPGFIIQNIYGRWAMQGYSNDYAVDNNANYIDWYRHVVGVSFEHSFNASTFLELSLQNSGAKYNANPPPSVQYLTYFAADGSLRHKYYSEFSLVNTLGDTIVFPTFPRGYDYKRYSELSGQYATDQNGYYLKDLLDSFGYEDSRRDAWTAKADVTVQLGSSHQLKGGILFTTNHIEDNRWGAFPPETDSKGNLLGYNGSHFNARFNNGGLYLQDKIEYQAFVMNIGMRFDFYQVLGPQIDVWNNPNRPDLYGYYQRNVFLDSLPAISRDVPLKWSVSPRLGIAHTVTENSKLYFNYGQFIQIPTTNNLYWLRYGLNGRLQFVGNAFLELPKTTSYEIGYEHELFPGFRMSVNGFYKDARNQPQFVNYNNGNSDTQWFSYADYSYWTQKGFEFQLYRRDGHIVNGFANASWLLTTYGSSGPTMIRPDDIEFENRNTAAEARSLAKRTFDPVLRAKVGLFIHIPDDFGPAIADEHLFGNWNVNWVVKWRQGSRFHWDPTGLSDENDLNHKWKDYWMVDVKIEKGFKLAGVNLSLYCDIFNVFNIKNFNVTDFGEAVYEGTTYYQAPGSARYTFAAFGKDASEEFDRYMRRIIQTGKEPGDEVEEAYMPKRKHLTYLFPRDIWFGLRVGF